MMPDRKISLCDNELIHIPGAIQPHGAMLVTRTDEWLVSHASANLHDMLGLHARAVLGRPLRDAIGEHACAALQGIEPSNGVGPTAVQLAIIGPNGCGLHLRANRLGRQVCIDIEPADLDARYTSPLMLTQPVLDSFKHATSGAELCDLAVRGLQAITFYDRVMVYRFTDTGDGEVVAEICGPPIESCLGLRFPASDIPPQARRQYLRQRVGMVPDACYTPVPMLADPLLDDRLPIDMTYSQLRSVSPLHREYMRNMKTRASLTVGLVDGDRVWGMMVCHHATPRVSGTELRAAANVIGQVVSLLHGSLRQADLSTQRLRRNTMLRTLVDRLSSSVTLATALDAVQSELLHLVDASGIVIRLSGTTLVFGRAPDPKMAGQIVAMLQTESGGEIMAVDDMGCRYPDSDLPMDSCCGALILPLSYNSDDAILWLRPEHWQTVNWGGDPASHDQPDPHSGTILPRKSFQSWKEVVKHRSLPWTQADIALAAEVARRLEAEIVRRTKAELAQAQDASRAKSRFLAGMTHELRTPLHGILGYAQLLSAEGGLNALQAMRVHAMMGASTHLLEMINRVLELSEIEAEQVRLCPAPVEVEAVISACLDVVRPTAQAKGLVLSIKAAPGMATDIVADSMRLRQMLLNLLGNAVKFTDAGTVEVRLARAATASAIRIEVADTGPGIPATQRTRLFQDFERLENHDLASVEGAGLGLALSARLAALMGGCIGFEPGETGGSVFWLELPYGTALPQPAHTAAPTPAAGTPAHKQALRVLAVDDVAINRDIAVSFLRAAGHAATAASSGEEALMLVESQDFDAVLMDVRMPGMDGLEATRRIRALGGARGAVPVIALTAQAFADQVEACKRAGMQDHLAKPFSPDMLEATVTRAARNRQPAEAAAKRRRPPAQTPFAAPGPPASGPALTDFPLVDEAVFEKTASYLPAESVASYLDTINELGTALLAGLRAPDAGALGQLADLAHTLAGSAGMFGFTRAANLARCFEHAVHTGSGEWAALAGSLDQAMEATLHNIAERRAAPAPALRALS
jgi:light-regulated signal transduction histidine kinase (bacteriophytochrome)/DNA-binding NarL/FixJ family response regulator/HPt (histidine-containing phosphotransfer) domain-containing protein